MIELGVNIDHVATLRQARRTYEPDPVWAAAEAHLGGADGITVHLREDRRHIQDEDVRRLRALVQIKLNLEMAATDEMIALACALKPEMAMLVPEGRARGYDRGWSRCRWPGGAPEDRRRSAGRRRHHQQRIHRCRNAPGRGRGAHRRAGLRDPHRPLCACVPRQGTRPAERGGGRGAGEGARGRCRHPRARHALQRRARAQLFQRAVDRGIARRARAAYRACDCRAARFSSACARRYAK